MALQYNEAFVPLPQSGDMVLLKNKLHYLIPLIKSLPGLPRVSKVKCRLCTMTPATKPLCQAPHARHFSPRFPGVPGPLAFLPSNTPSMFLPRVRALALSSA